MVNLNKFFNAELKLNEILPRRKNYSRIGMAKNDIGSQVSEHNGSVL